MSKKPCPMMIAHYGEKAATCIGERCAWWCEFAGECSVPLIAGILADSTICQNEFNPPVDNEQTGSFVKTKRCSTCLHGYGFDMGKCHSCVWMIDPESGEKKIPSNWEPRKEDEA